MYCATATVSFMDFVRAAAGLNAMLSKSQYCFWCWTLYWIVFFFFNHPTGFYLFPSQPGNLCVGFCSLVFIAWLALFLFMSLNNTSVTFCPMKLSSVNTNVSLLSPQSYIHGSSQAQFVAESHIILLLSILLTHAVVIPRITRWQKLIRDVAKIRITHSSSSAFGMCSKLILATDSFISSFVCTKANLCTSKPAANGAVCCIYSSNMKNYSFVCVCSPRSDRLLDRANRPYKQWRLSSFNVASLPDLFQKSTADDDVRCVFARSIPLAR